MRLALLAVTAGCMTLYTPGAWSPKVAVTTLGCLDVGVAATRRPEAMGPVAVISLGNRCEHHVGVDLGALRVVAGNDDGATSPTIAFDPERAIEAESLPARSSGDEWIEYRPTTAIERIDWLDVDVGGVAPAAGVSAHWVRARVSP